MGDPEAARGRDPADGRRAPALNQTGKERAGQLTNLEKQEATLALIQERMAKQLGDLDRTVDSNASTGLRVAAAWRHFRDLVATTQRETDGPWALEIVEDAT